MSPYFLQLWERLLASSEDVKCFFYAMSLPKDWLKFLGFNKVVPPDCVPEACRGQNVHLASRVLPMGFGPAHFFFSKRRGSKIKLQVSSKQKEESKKQGRDGSKGIRELNAPDHSNRALRSDALRLTDLLVFPTDPSTKI